MATDRRKTGSLPYRAVFDLHALEWTAPDRIEVSGEFRSLESSPTEPPVLVVHGDEATQRLQAVPESVSGAPEEGQVWRAEFAWDAAPFSFEAASLEFGESTLVELYAPSDGNGDAAGSAADQLQLHAQLLAAEAAAREARAEADRLRTELARAGEDLESERARGAADAERFRQGLESVQNLAEEALADQKSAVGRLGSHLDEANETIATQEAELTSLRERVAALERSSEDAVRARADADRAEADAQAARADNARLSERLARIREALDDS